MFWSSIDELEAVSQICAISVQMLSTIFSSSKPTSSARFANSSLCKASATNRATSSRDAIVEGICAYLSRGGQDEIAVKILSLSTNCNILHGLQGTKATVPAMSPRAVYKVSVPVGKKGAVDSGVHYTVTSSNCPP